MKVKSFIKFLLGHFDEDNNIEVSQAYGDCSLRKLAANEVDSSFIWITDKYDNDSYYHGSTIDKQYELEDSIRKEL